MKLRFWGALALTAATCTTPALAAPTQFAGNGHWYEFVSTRLNWDDARAAAGAASYNGLTGYLATITSAEENTFAATLLNGLAAYVGGSDAAVEGQWMWLTGPEAGTAFGYNNWNVGEPNNAGTMHNEDVLHIGVARTGGWNDIDATGGYGYLIEYSAFSVAPATSVTRAAATAAPLAVPEPGTALLTLLALGAATGLRRRR
jgi:Lectin C-type domain/PEP-CTERM motif